MKPEQIKEFYLNWRKQKGITVENYNLNPSQIIKLLYDFESFVIAERLSNEWVSVEERLPEETGYYLCIYDGGIYILKYWDGSKNWVDENGDPWYIKLWQPLPELPKTNNMKNEFSA